MDAASYGFQVSGSEKLTILSSGNVGIGTTSPRGKVDITNGSTGQTYSNISGLLIDVNGSSNSYYGLRVGSNTGNSHLVVTNAGNVGIGTTSPARKLEVYNGSSSMISQFRSGSGTSSFICFANTVSTADQVRIGSISTNLVLSTNYTERMRITSTGNVGIGTTSPSSKLSIRDDGAQLSLQRADDIGTEWKFYSWTSGLNIFPAAASEIYIGRDGATTNLQLHNGILKVVRNRRFIFYRQRRYWDD